MRRVGHKGADLLAPGNTIASFDAALAAGVDMIEFDVLPQRPGIDAPLVLAHDYEDAAGRSPQSLAEGLDHLSSDAFTGIELDVDLKLPGYELEVVDALRERCLLGRALVTSQYRESLALIRRAAPDLRLGWSVPRLRRDPFRSRPLRPLALAAVQYGRAVMPGLAAAAVRTGACDVLMAHWRLVTPRLVRKVEAAGGEVYAWTVDDPPLLRSMRALGVSGVITNDPRLFAAVA